MSEIPVESPRKYGQTEFDVDKDLVRKVSGKTVAELQAIAANMRNPERIDANGNWLSDSDDLPERVSGVAAGRDEQAVDEDVLREAGDSDRHYGR